MEKFVIKGGCPLKGEVLLSGTKNSATAILASSLLSKEPTTLRNLPLVEDVFRMLEILESLGAEINWTDKKSVKVIPPARISFSKFRYDLVDKLRSSVLFAGPLGATKRQFALPEPGGCIIGKRPVDSHTKTFLAMGFKVESRKGKLFFKRNRLRGKTVVMPEISVTATENLLMLSSAASGESVIRGAAIEPHVQELAATLRKRGAQISLSGGHNFRVKGNSELKGLDHALSSDPIEAATFLLAFALTKGRGSIYPIETEIMDMILFKVEEAGIQIDIKDKTLQVKKSDNFLPFHIKTLPYPGFPTDLQAPFGLLATQAEGNSLMHDSLYENRFNYLKELKKMGARFEIKDPHRAVISGPASLQGKTINSFDLRAGATLILAGLIAKGKTVIKDIYQVDRGYEKIDDKLKAIGADIDRV